MDNKDIYQIFKKNPHIAQFFITLQENSNEILKPEILFDINQLITVNKHTLKNRNFIISDYQSTEAVYDGITNIVIEGKIESFLKNQTSNSTRKLITNKTKALLKDAMESKISLDVISDNIFNKISRYKNSSTFNTALQKFIKQQKNNSIVSLIEHINKNQSLNVDILEIDYDKNRLVIDVKDFESCQQLGSPSWCISTSKNYWDTYISNDKEIHHGMASKYFKNSYKIIYTHFNSIYHQFYNSFIDRFIQDFNINFSYLYDSKQLIAYNLNQTLSDKEQMIGVTVNNLSTGNISASHYKDDSSLPRNQVNKYIPDTVFDELKNSVNINMVREMVNYFNSLDNNLQERYLHDFFKAGLIENPIEFKQQIDESLNMKYNQKYLLDISLNEITSNLNILNKFNDIKMHIDFIAKYFPSKKSAFYDNLNKGLLNDEVDSINKLSKSELFILLEDYDFSDDLKDTLLIKHFTGKTSFKTLINDSEYRMALEKHIKLYGNPLTDLQKSNLLKDCQADPALDHWYKKTFQSFSLEMLKNRSTFSYLNNLNTKQEIDFFIDNLIIDSKKPSPKILNTIFKLNDINDGYLSKEIFKKVYQKTPDVFFTHLASYKRYNNFFADIVINHSHDFNHITHKKAIQLKIKDNIFTWLKDFPDDFIITLKQNNLDTLFQETLDYEYPGLQAINNVSSSLNKKPSKKMKP